MIQYKRNKEILCITQKLFKVVLEILYNFAVTPCVGVWIEIISAEGGHPTTGGHSLRGSVD